MEQQQSSFKEKERIELREPRRFKVNSAVVGIYSYDIAHSKVQKATRMARNEGFPLRLTVTPEEEE